MEVKNYTLKLIYLFILLILSVGFTNAQKRNNKKNLNVNFVSQWNNEGYQKLSHKDYRENKLFRQKINFNKPDYRLLDACIFFAVNEQRAKLNKSILTFAPELEVSAYFHSKQMAENDFFSHTNSKEPKRKTPELRAQLAGINNPAIAENIAMRAGFEDNITYLELSDLLINQWMNSAGHRANILHKSALQLGCGVYFKDSECYATQCFQWFKPIKSQKASDVLP
jgi:hypothetical protein